MVKRMLIDATHPEETRVVVLNGNRLEEFDFESASKKQLKGNIYLAKVTRVEPSLQAAFVDYGGNRHGFLAFNEIHPDYYRIPIADREALIAEARAAEREREAAQDAEDDEDDDPGRAAQQRAERDEDAEPSGYAADDRETGDHETDEPGDGAAPAPPSEAGTPPLDAAFEPLPGDHQPTAEAIEAGTSPDHGPADADPA